MTSQGAALVYRRLRAPQADGERLVEPPLASVGALLEHNRALAGSYGHDLHGRTLRELAQSARRDLLRHAWSYTRQYRDVRVPDQAVPDSAVAAPILLAGHQPQLFHPGVWFKNFALSSLAAQHRGTAVNLVIDSDTIKSAAVRVPGGTIAEPLVEAVPLDEPTAEIPYEERSIVNRACLETFGARAAQMIEKLVPDPILREFWPLVVGRARECQNLGECLSQARHQEEGRWQAQTLELPQSRIGDFESFHWFAAHLLARAGELRDVYNGAVAEYRRINHVRSAAHPVPDLACDDDWIESPFWVWEVRDPRRRRLFVRRRGRETVLADREGLEVPLELSPEGDARAAVEQIAALRRRGIKLRTRALVTTMFARVVLGDLFLHGIGGAKYDQVTDLIITRLLGIEPPAYMTVTATLRLPIARSAGSLDDARRIDQELREITYHPERLLSGVPRDGAVGEAIAAKRRWIATPATSENARVRCRAIRAANEALQPPLAARRAQLVSEREIVAAALPGQAILHSRDYAFCLYPKAALLKLAPL